MKTDPSIFGWLLQPKAVCKPTRWVVQGTWQGRKFYYVFDDQAQATTVAGFYNFSIEAVQ